MDHTDRERSSTRRAPIGRAAAIALVLGVLAAAMFGGAAGATTPTTAKVVSTAKNDKLGTILVSGNTLYTLETSNGDCAGKCLKVWKPVVLPDGVTKAKAGSGVDAKKLGTVAAADGALQITYDGDPLYWYAKDSGSGDVKGNTTDKFGTGAAVVTAKASSGSGSEPSTGGNAF